MTITAWSDIAKRLEAGLQSIPVPTSYYIGRRHGQRALPENILLFLRRGLRVTPIAHYHHRHVLIIALDGTGGVIIDRYVHHLQPGQAVLVLPHQLHHYVDIHPPLSWLFIGFEQEPGIWRRLVNRRVELAVDQEAFIARLIALFLDPRPQMAQRLALVLRLLLDELCDRRLPAPAVSEAEGGGRTARGARASDPDHQRTT